MSPVTGFGNGDDVRGAIVLLAPEAGRYDSGAKLVMDGGFAINAGV